MIGNTDYLEYALLSRTSIRVAVIFFWGGGGIAD